MFLNRKLFLPFSFGLLYLSLISAILYIYINIFSDYNKDLESTKNKIIGVKYLKLLHDISFTTIKVEDKKIKDKSIQINIKAIDNFLKIHPKFNDKRLEKHLEFFKKSNINYDDTDLYNFVDFINNENYRAGNKAGILFSKDKQRYFLGTLITHYLPELFISLGISHSLLEELIKNRYLDENKKNIYIEQNKLVHLSSEEVHNIISLLDKDSSNKNLFTSIEEFQTVLEELKISKNKLTIFDDNSAKLESSLNITHKLIEISEKLNNQNRQLLEKLFRDDEKYLSDKMTQYNILIFFIILFLTVIFIYSFFIYKSNIQKDKHIFQQSRLAQMGEMISMIAHQWRQPLGAISATAVNIQLAIELEEFDLETKEGIDKSNEYFLERLENINGFVNNLTVTIDDFRNFYKPNKKSVLVKLDEVIIKALSIIKASLISDNIEILEHYNSSSELEIYDSEMMQVILNILKNAQDNFKEKGTQKPQIRITTDEKTISICNNGGGISESILDKIFDPYFSTKDELNGTGLGLYMSKTIVEDHHNGKLHVENKDDGVCFIIELGDISEK
jgi:signal transduction histidine kinase